MDKQNTIKFIKDKNFVASKKLGQNFLINPIIKQRIVDSADLNNTDLILEIGPGLGSLTEFILKCDINVLCVEIDKRLCETLKFKYNIFKKFNIINSDFLNLNIDEIISEFKSSKCVVISNLPYSISSLVIAKLCLSSKIDHAILMVQKEMAERICAKVNSKQYNAFTAWLSLSAKIKPLFDVANTNFVPVPKVKSTVVRVDFCKNYTNAELQEYKNFFNLAFFAKRKTLINNLIKKYNKQDVLRVFELLKISELTRASALDPQQLIQIYKNLRGNYEN